MVNPLSMLLSKNESETNNSRWMEIIGVNTYISLFRRYDYGYLLCVERVRKMALDLV